MLSASLIRSRWLGVLVALAAVTAVTGLLYALIQVMPAESGIVVYLIPVLFISRFWGLWLGIPTAFLSAAAFDYFHLPPFGSFLPLESASSISVSVFLIVAVVTSSLSVTARTLAGEHAALRRVATLVAQAAPPEEIFETVIREVGRLSGADFARMERYDEEGAVTRVAVWSRGEGPGFVLGAHIALEGPSIAEQVLKTGRPARMSSYAGASGPIAEEARRLGIHSSVGCPIVVGGHLWGVIAAASQTEACFSSEAESQIAEFTELVATAIAGADSRDELRLRAAEQAALRRVATHVAAARSPSKIFAAVADEVGELFGADNAAVTRFEPDGTSIVVVGRGEEFGAVPAGERWEPSDYFARTAVWRSGRFSRVDEDLWNEASDPVAEKLRRLGVRSVAASPVVVERHLWGAIVVSSKSKSFPSDTEDRMTGFTELVGMAIANAATRGELIASRARVVAAGDEARRRIERDLHDGAQQRLVHAVITLKLAGRAMGEKDEDAAKLVKEALSHTEQANAELRDLAHGIIPSVLTRGGLRAGVESLVTRLSLPVSVDMSAERFPSAFEATAYFVISEALTNVAKHSGANRASVRARVEDGVLRVEVRDTGVGGAKLGGGTGLIGLHDRVAAIEGELRIESPAGAGTRVVAALPVPS